MNDSTSSTFRRGQTVTVLRDSDSPLRSPNTRLVAAALASGARFANDRPFIDAVEHTDDGPKRVVTWCMSGEPEIQFRPDFLEEAITFAEFRRRFESRAWCEANPHHPISHMRAFSHQMNHLLDFVKGYKPSLLVRKGRRLAVIPTHLSEEAKAEILKHF